MQSKLSLQAEIYDWCQGEGLTGVLQNAGRQPNTIAIESEARCALRVVHEYLLPYRAVKRPI